MGKDPMLTHCYLHVLGFYIEARNADFNIHSSSQRNFFALYVEVLERLTGLFFALDRVNYSRWMPVHINDMKSLPESIKKELKNRVTGSSPKQTIHSHLFLLTRLMSRRILM